MLASVVLALSLAAGGPGEACDPGPPLVAEANDESVPLSSRLQVLEDARHELTLEQVASPPACTRFLRPERLETRGGSRYWLRLALELRGDQARGWLLFLDVSNFERACVHWPLAAGGHATRCASVGAPGGVGSVRHNRLVYSVPRELDPLRPSFLELDSRAPQALRGRLVRPERFLEEDLPVQFASGLFNGLLFATVLYNLIFFVAARDRVNLFFAIHLLGPGAGDAGLRRPGARAPVALARRVGRRGPGRAPVDVVPVRLPVRPRLPVDRDARAAPRRAAAARDAACRSRDRGELRLGRDSASSSRRWPRSRSW